jgi:very-short-patch-repair endonuclease
MSSGIPYAICDLYCPAAGVDNEYNGIGHELQNARIHDGNRNNGLKAMGIHVLVINRDQMKDLVALEAFAQTMHRLAGARFRYRIKGYRKRQAAWLNALRAGIGLAPV